MEDKSLAKEHFKIFTIILTACILLSFVYLYLAEGIPVNPIRSDGWGYYSYLPALFDYGDLSFSFSSEAINTNSIWINADGNVINKYPIGVAVLEFPFYIVVDVACKLFAPDMATGYTTPYQAAVLCASTFYFLVGLSFLRKTLQSFFTDKITGWVILSICFGTSLFHYATYDACFSHIYSFFLINAFVWLVIRQLDGLGAHFILGLLAGMILVTRNPNIVVLFFYPLYSVTTMAQLRERLTYIVRPKRLLPTVFGGAIVVSIQSLYWYMASGHFIIRSYSDSETFSWLMPHIMEILLSVKKGLFFYSPILGISLCGIFIAFNSQRKSLLPAVLSVILSHFYITASWDCWQYGGSFGQRPFVDVYVFYALLLGFVYERMDSLVLHGNGQNNSTVFNIFKPLLILLIFFSIKFMLAYWHGILPFSDATTQDIAAVFEWDFSQIRERLQNILTM